MAIDDYYVEFAGSRCTDFGAHPVNRPEMPTPVRRAQKVTVPGRDGDLYIEDGAIEDIQIQVTFNFHTEPEEWCDTFRILKAWATNGQETNFTKLRVLRFSDDLDYFYNVKRTIVSTTERIARRIGKATVTFICEGWTYLNSGRSSIAMSGSSMTLENPTGEIAKPVIRMTVTRPFTLTISNTSGTTNTFSFIGSAPNVIIDARRGAVYRLQDGSSVLNRTTGNIDAFYLLRYDTQISIDATPSLFEVYPLWRVL